MKTLNLLILSLLLAGCASVADIHQSSPQMALSEKSPKELSNCIALAAQDGIGSYWDAPVITESKGTYRMLITSGFITPSRPFAELMIFPSNPDGSKVEYRTAPIWGAKDKFWHLVQHCAAP